MSKWWILTAMIAFFAINYVVIILGTATSTTGLIILETVYIVGGIVGTTLLVRRERRSDRIAAENYRNRTVAPK